MLLVEKSWSGVLLQKGKLHNCLSVLISKVSSNPSYVTDGVEASGDFSSRSVTSLQTEVLLWKVASLPVQAFKKKKKLAILLFLFQLQYPSVPGASKSGPILNTAKQNQNVCFLNYCV